ncbi:hypothetical protein GCM10011352_03620 [Marinobacterium zhoushanense]|uniref:Lipoprotein n=1 Tax=Marinobacterium zhoushanense TaxID=1679163 RepID=A0ABQ1JXI8_9GAMM|nr:hypothetical protein [Marinobacterium zhoushanense]GGB81176.1 hypothetical protein GCM10011352_03620 [Marinobacterium zhoushanense]
MAKRYMPLLLALCALAGCTWSEQNSPRVFTQGMLRQSLSLHEMLDCVATNDGLNPAQVRQRQSELEQQQSSDNPAAQFRLACLLGRSSASDTELVRARQLLDQLQRQPALEPEQVKLLTLYQRHLLLTQRLRQQLRETREYRDKIEQLKGLEEELEPATVEQETAE